MTKKQNQRAAASQPAAKLPPLPQPDPLTLTVTIPGPAVALFKATLELVIAMQPKTTAQRLGRAPFQPWTYEEAASRGLVKWIVSDEVSEITTEAFNRVLRAVD